MTWQPIETAPPHDVVLLCDSRGNRWTDTGAGAVECYEHNGCGFPPTHWMPLPEPPVQLEQGRAA